MTALTTPEIQDLPPVTAAAIDGEVRFDKLPEFFDSSFGRLVPALNEAGVQIIGAAFAFYPMMPGATATLSVGFPTDQLVAATGDIHGLELPGGPIARVDHVGSYDGLAAAWNGLAEWVLAQGRAPRGDFWEVYVTEPGPDKDPSTYVTELYLPLVS